MLSRKAWLTVCICVLVGMLLAGCGGGPSSSKYREIGNEDGVKGYLEKDSVKEETLENKKVITATLLYELNDFTKTGYQKLVGPTYNLAKAKYAEIISSMIPSERKARMRSIRILDADMKAIYADKLDLGWTPTNNAQNELVPILMEALGKNPTKKADVTKNEVVKPFGTLENEFQVKDMKTGKQFSLLGPVDDAVKILGAAQKNVKETIKEPGDGLKYSFQEGSVEIVMYPIASKAIHGIAFEDPRFATARGIKIGDDMSKVESVYGVPKDKKKDSNVAWYFYSDSTDSNPFNGKSIAFAYESNAASPFVKGIIYSGIYPASGGKGAAKQQQTPSSASITRPTRELEAFTVRIGKGIDGVVKVYAGPSLDAPVIATIKEGTAIQGFGYQNGFYFLNTNVKGWVREATASAF